VSIGEEIMPQESYRDIQKLLASAKPEDLRKGLKLVKDELSRVEPREAKPLFEMVLSIFYIDTLDQPQLVPVLDEAVSLVAGFGEWVIPFLVEGLDAGDIKAQFAIAHALGRIGTDAIEPLMAEYVSSADPARRVFVLYALGKIKSPQIEQASRLALDAAQSPDLELRDTGTRAIGKFAESIPPSLLPEELRREFVEKLHDNLSHANPGIRSKAVRSLGKMARCGHLHGPEKAELKELCRVILGTDERFEWDRAFVVRKEAEEALRYV